MPHHVTHGYGQGAAGQDEGVVPATADLKAGPGRTVSHRDLGARHPRRLGEQAVLQRHGYVGGPLEVQRVTHRHVGPVGDLPHQRDVRRRVGQAFGAGRERDHGQHHVVDAHGDRDDAVDVERRVPGLRYMAARARPATSGAVTVRRWRTARAIG